MKYLLIGGAGYVGTRLWKALAADPQNEVEVIDLGLLWPEHVHSYVEWRDVRDEDPAQALDYDVVIWLATIHDTPESERAAWHNLTRQLMVDLPRDWERWARRFVYFSSMRAVTHPETLYGQRKLEFEARARESTLIIRPGTVWGDFHPDMPNRLHTAVNRQLYFPDQHIEVPENRVFLPRLVDATLECLENGTTGVVNAVDPEPEWQRPELGAHPMEHYRRHYGVNPETD